MNEIVKNENIVEVVKTWVELFVVKLKICPFAKRELLTNRIRFSVSDASCEVNLLDHLKLELELLNKDPEIETTLLIHADVLQNFYDYNEFLSIADKLLSQMKLNGIYQIASFHPDYQFNGTKPGDVENYTNKSPYPMLHILREDSVASAVSNYPNADKIPQRNIEMMERMGKASLEDIFQKCLSS